MAVLISGTVTRWQCLSEVQLVGRCKLVNNDTSYLRHIYQLNLLCDNWCLQWALICLITHGTYQAEQAASKTINYNAVYCISAVVKEITLILNILLVLFWALYFCGFFYYLHFIAFLL